MAAEWQKAPSQDHVFSSQDERLSSKLAADRHATLVNHLAHSLDSVNVPEDKAQELVMALDPDGTNEIGQEVFSNWLQSDMLPEGIKLELPDLAVDEQALCPEQHQNSTTPAPAMPSAHQGGAASSVAKGNVEDKAGTLLDTLQPGSKVALVVMRGSLCPITLAHVGCCLEARKILLEHEQSCRPQGLEQFHECIGCLCLNADGHVRTKMLQKGDHLLNSKERSHLVRLATTGYSWLGLSTDVRQFEKCWPHLSFVRFELNGADDVVRYRKWDQASPSHRLITIGRPGDTEKLLKGIKKARKRVDDKNFIVGPELPDISSSSLRTLLRNGEHDIQNLGKFVDIHVAEWCIKKWAQVGWSLRA